MEEKDYQRKEEEDYNRIVDLTRESEDLRRNVNSLRDELSKTEYSLRAANDEVRGISDALKKEEENNASLSSQVDKLTNKLDYERAATKDAEGRVQTLYADLDQARFAHRSIISDRDEALADKRDLELQLEDLKQQWEESEERIEMLQAELEDAEKMLNHAGEFENDIAGMREQIQEQERTIMVKDERISHLEMQVQKERQINYHTADAIARSKAASPVDDDRHIGAIGFDSLEAELSAIEDNEFYEIAWNDYSHIEETALTYEPITPNVQPPSSLHVQEAASISPVAAHAPLLTLDVREAGSLEPKEPAPVAACTISVSESTSTEPVAVVIPTHALTVREMASTKPVAAKVPTHALAVGESTSTEPVAATVPMHALMVQDMVNTEPIEPARAPLSSLHAQDIASFAPKAPAPAPQNTLNEHEVVSVSPMAPIQAPQNTLNEHEIASFAPRAPAPAPQNTLNEHEIANFAPRVPDVAALTVSVREAGDTIPNVRQISTWSSPTQTHVPLLWTEFMQHATVSTAPIEPFEIIDAPAVKPEVSATFTVDISPVGPKVAQRKMMTKGTQTVPESPKSPPSHEAVYIATTHEVEPIEPIVTKVEASHATTSTGVQTTMELPMEKDVEATRPALSAHANTKPTRATEYMLPILSTLLTLLCLHLYMQLDEWRYANGMGVGVRPGSNAASRYGAYGNGRHLFGVIPIGMSDSWLSRQISRHMLSALMRLETWAGAEYQPLY